MPEQDEIEDAEYQERIERLTKFFYTLIEIKMEED